MEKLRLAVVGFGKMGILQGALARATGLAEIIAIVEKNPKVRKIVRKAFRNRVPVLPDVEELRDHSADAIYVTTSVPSHYGVALRVLDARARGLFVEKPLTDDTKKSQRLAEATQTRGIITAVGYQRRFAPTFRYVKKLLEEEALGTVETVHAYAYSQDFLGLQNHGNQSVTESRGGLLRDLGSHAVDMALWVLGYKNVRVIDARFLGKFPCADVEVTLVVNNTIVVVSTSWCKAGYRIPEVGIEVTCSRGLVYATDDEVLTKKGSEEKRIYRLELGDKVQYLLASPDYFVENRQFIQSILSGTKFPEADFKEASIVDQVLSSCSF